VCVCLTAIISSKLYTSDLHRGMLPVAVARSSSGGVVMLNMYVLLFYGYRNIC